MNAAGFQWSTVVPIPLKHAKMHSTVTSLAAARERLQRSPTKPGPSPKDLHRAPSSFEFRGKPGEFKVGTHHHCTFLPAQTSDVLAHWVDDRGLSQMWL